VDEADNQLDVGSSTCCGLTASDHDGATNHHDGGADNHDGEADDHDGEADDHDGETDDHDGEADDHDALSAEAIACLEASGSLIQRPRLTRSTPLLAGTRGC
jgi:TATA-binding protein-associated factor Taf7